MRILHFYKTYYPETFGGVQQFIYQLCIGCAQKGVEANVLTLSEFGCEDQIILDGHIVFRSKRDYYIASNDISFSVRKKLKNLMADYDIIHYHFPWPFMDLIHFIVGVKKPTILTYHSDIVRQKFLLKFYTPLMYSFLKSVDRIVCTSPNYLESSPVLQRYKEKVSVIPIGLFKDGYEDFSENTNHRFEKFKEMRYFLFVGMIRYYKGLHVLIESMRELDYPLVIAGEGPIEIQLKKQAEDLGLRNIYFLGKITDNEKVFLLKNCYAFLFPSHLRSEAFGISLLEAAMFGKAMVSCEIGTGTTYINVANETGLVVNASSATELRTAICYMWDNPERVKEMGSKAFSRYASLFTASKMVDGYIQTYNEMYLGKNRGGDGNN